MFNLIIWILIVVILVRLAKLIGAKTKRGEKQNKEKALNQNGACGNTGSYFLRRREKFSSYYEEE